MKCSGTACDRSDLVRGRWTLVLWWAPTAVILGAAFVEQARAALWIPSFIVMGVACLVNARGCRRRHCWITGPLFLVAALVATLDAASLITVGWKTILAAVAVGTVAAYAFEWLRGRYVETPVL